MRTSATATAGQTTEAIGESPGAALLPIGPVAREVGLTPRAIRYYEELGLLRPAVRVKGADRLFDAADVQRLREIKRLREIIGFSLGEIAELLESDDIRAQLRARFHDAPDTAVRAEVLRDARELAERRLAIIERKLAQVAMVRDEELAYLARVRALLDARDDDATPGTTGAEGGETDR